ncbi:MAG: ankyrin repeat domain-containing protein [Parvibaculum sp.]
MLSRTKSPFLMKAVGAMALVAVTLFTFAARPANAVGLGQPDVVVPDSPFIEAVRDGDMEVVNAAIVRGQSIDARDKTGTPAIFVALQFSQNDMFKFLVEKGARVEVKDREGATLLSLLAGTKLYDIASIVLKAGADPDRPGANREPPIIIAARGGDAEMVKLLLDHDADYDATDLTGRTALNIARERRFSGIVNALEAAGAR